MFCFTHKGMYRGTRVVHLGWPRRGGAIHSAMREPKTQNRQQTSRSKLRWRGTTVSAAQIPQCIHKLMGALALVLPSTQPPRPGTAVHQTLPNRLGPIRDTKREAHTERTRAPSEVCCFSSAPSSPSPVLTKKSSGRLCIFIVETELGV